MTDDLDPAGGHPPQPQQSQQSQLGFPQQPSQQGYPQQQSQGYPQQQSQQGYPQQQSRGVSSKKSMVVMWTVIAAAGLVGVMVAVYLMWPFGESVKPAATGSSPSSSAVPSPSSSAAPTAGESLAGKKLDSITLPRSFGGWDKQQAGQAVTMYTKISGNTKIILVRKTGNFGEGEYEGGSSGVDKFPGGMCGVYMKMNSCALQAADGFVLIESPTLKMPEVKDAVIQLQKAL